MVSGLVEMNIRPTTSGETKSQKSHKMAKI